MAAVAKSNDNLGSGFPEEHIKELEKMLDIEIKCKIGAENLIHMYANNEKDKRRGSKRQTE